MSLPIYEDTKLFIDKEINMKWQDMNGTFLGTFEENLEDRRVYVNIHKSGLYRISCRCLTFPCMDMIHWILSQYWYGDDGIEKFPWNKTCYLQGKGLLGDVFAIAGDRNGYTLHRTQ